MSTVTGMFYSLDTGQLKPEVVTAGSLVAILEFAPAGHAVIEGRYDPLRSKVDLSTMTVVEWQSPGLAQAAALERRQQILAAIQGIEAKKLRPIGVLLIDAGNQVEREVLSRLEGQLDQLRAQLNQPNSGS